MPISIPAIPHAESPALTPARLKAQAAFEYNFWHNVLRPTRLTGACPQCGAVGLEVRSVRQRGQVYRYIHHCGGFRQL